LLYEAQLHRCFRCIVDFERLFNCPLTIVKCAPAYSFCLPFVLREDE